MSEPVAMYQEWNCLTFAHWAYEPGDVQRLLPPGLTVETFDGKAWVGLVAFDLRIRHRRTPYVPWAGRFAETNVRTYVRGPNGRTGIWFFSLDAERLGAVLVARATFRLPYMWARMRVVRTEQSVTYSSTRHRPHGKATSHLAVDLHEPIGTDDLAAFLTNRFVMWTKQGDRYRVVRAEHEPWSLRRATATAVDPGLLTAAGLPSPAGEPLVHYGGDMAVALRPRTVLERAAAG